MSTNFPIIRLHKPKALPLRQRSQTSSTQTRQNHKRTDSRCELPHCPRTKQTLPTKRMQLKSPALILLMLNSSFPTVQSRLLTDHFPSTKESCKQSEFQTSINFITVVQLFKSSRTFRILIVYTRSRTTTTPRPGGAGCDPQTGVQEPSSGRGATHRPPRPVRRRASPRQRRGAVSEVRQ